MERLVTKNGITFTIKGSSKHWDAFQSNTWETETFKLLDNFLQPDDTMLDIGAWIGPISLYAGQKVSVCYSFEPDPVAFQEFSSNLKLNPGLEKKIHPINKAITTDGKKVKLFSKWSHGDSGSSLLKRVKSKNDFVEVDSVIFKDLFALYNLNKVDFIKMDIEGGEFLILPTIIDFLREQKPTLLISFHYTALCEYFELQYFPQGALRRIYRLLDPKKGWIRKRANKNIVSLIESLTFYTIYDATGNIIPPERLNSVNFQQLDMLLFTTRTPNH